MTDKEFIDIVTELRELALRKGRGYQLATDEADDIAQETMLKLWALRTNISSVSHARGLAIIIAAHLSVDMLRKRRTLNIVEAVDEPPDVSVRSPESELEDKANEEWLEEQLQRLPSTEYQVLHLRQVEQKSTDEIAAILGITNQSVATLLSRARRKLLEQIRRKNKGL